MQVIIKLGFILISTKDTHIILDLKKFTRSPYYNNIEDKNNRGFYDTKSAFRVQPIRFHEMD